MKVYVLIQYDEYQPTDNCIDIYQTKDSALRALKELHTEEYPDDTLCDDCIYTKDSGRILCEIRTYDVI